MIIPIVIAYITACLLGMYFLYRHWLSTPLDIWPEQPATLKSSEVVPHARVVRIWRSPRRNQSQPHRVVPSAAMYRPASKWTVAAALILAVVLHAGAVFWIEMQQEKPAVAAAMPASVHTEEDFKTDTGTVTSGASGTKITAD